ncbi:GIY-YIG nuclease family protein [Vibrio sp. SCSIO 43137]|uniref:GIY-YIG nuclease family protein n=1 Tax=Vibrio sp. SCSIO 43137 TaxID=3021011 RepID=UPI00230752B5|nr:GIY-YIG nuclease family protein [Vibrio sp. SCSIO 43137]WCE31451.1 GIY-YIG nuclease family protein [Vibrio sp. SCSIO 43137]
MTDVSINSDVWCVYLIRTRHNTLYCGITNDLSRRFSQHSSGKGAKYLKGKGPLELVWSHKTDGKSSALKLEIKIKKLNKRQKEQLVTGVSAVPAL